jgi:hypothetical protein
VEETRKQYTYFQNTKELVIAGKSERMFKINCIANSAFEVLWISSSAADSRDVWRSRLWRSQNSLAAGFNDIRSYHLSVDSIPFLTFMLVIVNYKGHIWAVPSI